MDISTPPVSSPQNFYLYNNKELQSNTQLYDYGARFYDPVVGRWDVIDELAENFEATSSYAYVLNNPLKLIDLDGRDTGKVHVLREVVIKAKPSEKAFINPPAPIFEPLTPIKPIPRITLGPVGPAFGGLGLFIYLLFSPQQAGESNEQDALKKWREKYAHKAQKTVEEILEDTTPGRETKGRAKQYEKDGGDDQANEDFDDIVDPTTIKQIPNGRIGRLPDGTFINVRSGSSDGRPTVEIQTKNPIKIRYNTTK